MDTDAFVPGPGGGGASCDEAEELEPLVDVKLTGTLGGSDGLRGWCGGDDGNEDVYLIRMVGTRDLLIETVGAESDFSPTIRVEEDTCGQASAVGTGLTRLCTGSTVDDPKHVTLLNGHDYYITVDSPAGSNGDYAVNLTWAKPPLEMCKPHPEVIELDFGSVFQWQNSFGMGQGDVDGVCGGPGREDMFRMDVPYPGYLYAEVNGSNGFDPLISLRLGCPGVAELTCTSEPVGDSYAYLDYWIENPGTYWLAVDQTDVSGGYYDLFLYFE